MAVAVVANDTRGAAHAGAMKISAKKIKARIDAIDYFNKHVPWAAGDYRQPDSRACARIRETLPMVESSLDDSYRRVIRAMKGRYGRAMEHVADVDLLSQRVKKLEELQGMLESMGKREITGKAAEVVAHLLSDSEALVCKKIGTAYLRLYSEKYEYSCLCLARKNLENAGKIWERIEPGGIDLAKALYWLALAKYIDGDFEGALENAEKCLQATRGKPERQWLEEKAKILRTDAKVEQNSEYLSR